MPDSLPPETLTIAGQLGELARLATWADAFAARAHMPPSRIYALQLCLEEQVSNIIRHGGGATVSVTLARQDGVLIATIADPGPAFDPLAAAAPDRPRTLLDARVGGLGIHLMRTYASAIRYARADGMNRLTLEFDLVA